MSKPHTKQAGPLSHITVLDMSRVLAGPWSTQILADFGATVIKVEHPERNDATRQWGPPYLPDKDGKPSNESAYYLAANRNKHGVAINFSTAEGQQSIRKLAQKADILVENFLPGSLARYGLDYASLSALNPRLVYCSITGFGQTGPLASSPGYDYMIQAASGLMSITGIPDSEGGQPMRVGIPVADLFTGMSATQAILAAIIARDTPGHPHHGKGQHIDICLFDVQLTMLANQLMTTLLSGKAPGRIGNRHPSIVPYQCFDTADTPIIIAVGTDEQYHDLCSIMEMPDLAEDRRFATNRDRVHHRGLLEGLLQQRFLSRPSAYWLEACNKCGIPAAPILDIAQAVEHPQSVAHELFQTVQHPLGMEVRLAKNPVIFSGTPVATPKAPPMLGEHNELYGLPPLKR